LAKIAVGGAVLVGLGMATMSYAQKAPLPTVEKVELDRYLGTWYEVARKPLVFQQKCDRNVTATYTLNENGNINVDNRCVQKDGQVMQSLVKHIFRIPRTIANSRSDRKSTRLNSSHVKISYAVFCLKKKTE